MSPLVSRTPDADEPFSTAIIDIVADIEETDPTNIDRPLYEVVDPDALDRLFAASDRDEQPSGRVVFRYYGYEIEVRSDGRITVDEAGDCD